MKDYSYRQGVNAVVIDDNKNFLLVQKNAYSDNQWDFPGGGVEDNEKPEVAIIRELKEELGSDKFNIVKKSPYKIKFEWPDENIQAGYKKHGQWWRGQEKIQFIVKFTGNKDLIVLQKEEIRDIKWVRYDKLKDHLVFEGQWENAKKVIEDAKLDS
jgi:putative (di)nucleoside polyphosphate hydrolase